MNTRAFSSALGLVLLWAWNSPPAWSQPANPARPHIAVLNLEARGISDDDAATLSERLRSHLVRTGAFVVLNRSRMQDILKEQGFQQSGCMTTECAVRIGVMLNVQKIVSGSIGKIGKTYAIDIVVIDVETGRIGNSFNRNYRGKIDGLLEALKSIAEEMAAESAGKGTQRMGSGEQAHLLTIHSYPNEAEVILNDKIIRKTPLSGKVRHGTRLDIRVRYPGYREWKTSLTMDQDVSLNLELVPLHSNARTTSSHSWLWFTGAAVAAGATAYFLISQQDRGGDDTESLPAFPWPPENK